MVACLSRQQAGLFSAVTSAFIIQFDSQLQPNQNNETAALLRVLIHKVDNTAFGDDVPTLPQWTGPPPAIVHVQTILFASLATSLFAAFLAMLGKQWLTRYASTHVRGSDIEHSQSRQRKLDGIVIWYFDYVIESLPWMLQVALFLLGCALSRYLWEIDITIASVVLGATSLGVLFYLFIVAAGTAIANCLYQTPMSRILRYLWLEVHPIPFILSLLGIAAQALKRTCMKSRAIRTLVVNARCNPSRRPISSTMKFWKDVLSGIPGALVYDVYRLSDSTFQRLISLPAGVSRRVRRLHDWLYRQPPTPEQRLCQKKIVLDLRCISWILRESLDNDVRISTFKHLMSIPELADFDPTLVVDCFDTFTGCIAIADREVITVQGLEVLGTVSAGSLFRTFHYLSVVDPASSILANLRRRYDKFIPDRITFSRLPFRYTMLMIHALFKHEWNPCYCEWERPHAKDQILFARYMAETARLGYRQMRRRKVPRWILRFALFSLSLDPPSPPSVIADCLTIVGIDLPCDFSNAVALDLDARCVQISSVSSFLTGS